MQVQDRGKADKEGAADGAERTVVGVGQQQVGELAGGAKRPLRSAVGAVEAVRPVAVALANGHRIAALRVATEVAPAHPPNHPPIYLPGRMQYR